MINFGFSNFLFYVKNLLWIVTIFVNLQILDIRFFSLSVSIHLPRNQSIMFNFKELDSETDTDTERTKHKKVCFVRHLFVLFFNYRLLAHGFILILFVFHHKMYIPPQNFKV